MTVVPHVTQIYADSRSVGTCSGRDCHRKILWATLVGSGKKMCFDDPELVALRTFHDDSHRLIEVVDLDANHWATCPNARDFGSRGSTSRR